MRAAGAKSSRRPAPPSSSSPARSYVGYGLALGFLLVLLTYLAVTTQYSAVIPSSSFSGGGGGGGHGELTLRKNDESDDHKLRTPAADAGEVPGEVEPEEESAGKGENEGLQRKQLDEEDARQKLESEQNRWQKQKQERDARASRTVHRREFEDSQDDADEAEEDPKSTGEGEQEEWRRQKQERLRQAQRVADRPEFDESDGAEDDPKATESEMETAANREADPVVTEPVKREKTSPEKKEEQTPRQFAGGSEDFNLPAQGKPVCDQSFAKYDVCNLDGDVRTVGGASLVMLVSPRSAGGQQEWKIKPYSRKYLDGLKEVTVRTVSDPQGAPPCAARLNVPAMVIHLGGLTGNYWHDFTDVLIPLFIGARQFNTQVQFLVVNMLPFWVDKYKKIFTALSRYEMIDFNADYSVRCYPHAVVGYGSYKEFTIDPAQTASGYTMVDFTKFLRETYSLGRDAPIRLRDSPGKRPRMMIIDRTNSRKLVNLPEVVGAAEKLGFEVVVIGKADVSYEDFARIVNSFDVMLGVHGAGLTNCVYLPTGAVLIQVVPYGKIEHIAKTDFGDPARDMGLRYIEYSIAAEESTLSDVFGKEHPMIADPLAIHRSGWGHVAEWYLGKQDVRIDVGRFAPALKQALEYLQ